MRSLKNTSILFALCLAGALYAAQPLSEQFYNAIRSDNQAALAMLISSADVNARDSRENTPLMYAAAVGSLDTMKKLLAAGADVNAKNSFDSTAIMWCTNDLAKGAAPAGQRR